MRSWLFVYSLSSSCRPKHNCSCHFGSEMLRSVLIQLPLLPGSELWGGGSKLQLLLWREPFWKVACVLLTQVQLLEWCEQQGKALH